MKSKAVGNVIISFLALLILGVAVVFVVELFGILPNVLTMIYVKLVEFFPFIMEIEGNIFIAFSFPALLFSALLWILHTVAKENRYNVAAKIVFVSYVISLVVIVAALVFTLVFSPILKIGIGVIIAVLVFIASIVVPILFMRDLIERMNIVLASIVTYLFSPIFIVMATFLLILVVMIFLLKVVVSLMGTDTSSWKIPFISGDKEKKEKNKYAGSFYHHKYQGIQFEGYTEIDNHGVFKAPNGLVNMVDNNGIVRDSLGEIVGKIVKTLEGYEIEVYKKGI